MRWVWVGFQFSIINSKSSIIKILCSGMLLFWSKLRPSLSLVGLSRKVKPKISKKKAKPMARPITSTVISRMLYWVELHSIMSYNQHQLRDHCYRYVFIYHVIKCAHYSNISLIFLYDIVYLSVVNINSNSINSKKMYNIHCIQHQIRLLLGNKNHAMLYQGQKFQDLLLKNI